MSARDKLREILGLPKEEPMTSPPPSVMMNNIPIPMDILMEILIRQQNQLFTEIGNLNGRIAAMEAISAGMIEQTDHLHGDVIELQQALQTAAQHPVEKIDAEEPPQTEEQIEKNKKNLIN